MKGCNDITRAHSFTRSAVLLTMAYDGTELATGSGVIARDSHSSLYLITAWHNLSGKRPDRTVQSARMAAFLINCVWKGATCSLRQTCYVLGFPEGLIHRPFEKATFPIWKTGNIASEPLFDFDGQPKLLIDATTRSGMSGAMVVVSEKGLNRFVGVYSGRYKQAESGDSPDPNPYFTSELGWVFRSEVVSELIGVLRRG